MLQQETLTYSFVCIYLLTTAFCFYVFMLRQQIEQAVIALIKKVTGVDIELMAFTSSADTAVISIASKAALAGIKAFLFLHGLLAAMLVAGVLVELI